MVKTVKKFGYNNLTEIILKIKNQELHSQKVEIEKELNTWRGTEEQIDDMCLLGIRF